MDTALMPIDLGANITAKRTSTGDTSLHLACDEEGHMDTA